MKLERGSYRALSVFVLLRNLFGSGKAPQERARRFLFWKKARQGIWRLQEVD